MSEGAVAKVARLRSGLCLRYREQGNPVVMLRGITDWLHSFELVLQRLPESVRAFVLTQRGHGDADRPAAG